uniref:Synapsin n=1 Tax=Aceria tosichella TaxID=561515 RepID=A0A6G1SQT9_9ACAR
MNPREMERYNPFAADNQTVGPGPADTADNLKQAFTSLQQQQQHQNQPQQTQRTARTSIEAAASEQDSPSHRASAGRYSTSFPDPFELDDNQNDHQQASASSSRFAERPQGGSPRDITSSHHHHQQQPPSNRSNSVTFLHRIGDRDDDQQQQQGLPETASSGHRSRSAQRGGRQAGAGTGGFTSFLSRATSVTSSSVTDRVSGAVGSVRSAVDSLSSQIQQAVPSSSNLISSAASSFTTDQQQAAGGLSEGQQSKQQQQSAASYLASRLSSATNQFVGGGSGGASLVSASGSLAQAGQHDGQTATICRQRVVLILDNPGGTDWAQQFNQYRRLVSGLAPQSSASLVFTSFFAAQFSSASSLTGGGGGAGGGQSDGTDSDLIEQVNFKDASVLANQSSATAAVYVSGPSALGSQSTGSSSTLPINRLALNIVGAATSSTSQQHQQQQLYSQHHNHQHQIAPAKTIRPEYVVVRQRGREHLGHLKSIVKALDYCCVPMFEPYEVWNVFQDRQQIFAKLLRVQRHLGKENFPLIPQVFCQTHQDLLNYINNSYISLPCLVRTGPLGKGKIRIDNLQMLKDFATIMATSEQSCTIEQYLDVKCDLIVQKLGTSLKLFKGKLLRKDSLTGTSNSTGGSQAAAANSSRGQPNDSVDIGFGQQQQQQQQSTTTAGGGGSRPSISAQDSFGRQAASRQTSLGNSSGGGGGGGLFGLMSTTGAGSQLLRHNSNPSSTLLAGQSNFEKLSEVNSRYRRWVEAISREFDNKIDVFCIKIVVATNDREYIVGLRNCSMDFLGNQENQEEDRRSLVELIISKMNTILPKHQPISREPSAAAGGPNCSLDEACTDTSPTSISAMNSDKRMMMPQFGAASQASSTTGLVSASGSGGGLRYGASQEAPMHNSSGTGNQMLNNRNRSVSMNQGEPMRPLNQAEWNQANNRQQSPLSSGGGGGVRPQSFSTRRASERSDSMLTNNDDSSLMSQVDSPSTATTTGSSNARQQSIGQSFFDQTSTALSSFQRQSLSFLRRLDTRTGAEYAGGSGAGTPPLSAKSDTGFDRVYGGSSGTGGGAPLSNGEAAGAGTGNYGPPVASTSTGQQRSAVGSTKSQSVDVNPDFGAHKQAHPPPKPPPPSVSFINRQSSLANYSSSSIGQQRASSLSQSRIRSESSGMTTTNKPMTPQNSLNQGSFSDEQQQQPHHHNNQQQHRVTANNDGAANQRQQQQRVIRQNSALSAFEPFDASLRSETYHDRDDQQSSASDQQQQQLAFNQEPIVTNVSSGSSQANNNANLVGGGNRQLSSGSGQVKYDTVSMKSGNSNTSDETTTAEDTMNNLKKTFASIFGDKCE